VDAGTYLAVLGLAIISGLTTLIGVTLALYVGRNPKSIAFGIGFSAGMMILISLLELIPHAWAISGAGASLAAIISGAGLVAGLHWIIPHTHLVKEPGVFDARALKTAYLVAFGLILHDLPEGFAMANSYLVSPSLAMLVTTGIALHNIPEEFAMAVPAVALKARRFLYRAALFSALAEPLGAAIGLAAAHLMPALNPVFMNAAAGAMIFVSLHELVPMARQYGNTGMFAAGFGASVLVYVLLGLIFPV
jgi:ZIP family zinc transporter